MWSESPICEITWQNVGGRVRESPKFGRPWESVAGRAPWLAQTDLLSNQSSMASPGLPNFPENQQIL